MDTCRELLRLWEGDITLSGLRGALLVNGRNFTKVESQINNQDKKVLRELGEEISRIASLPEMDKRKESWRKLNDLEPVKPLVWINDVPWHQMDVNNELKVKSVDSFLRVIETKLRRAIYEWKHMNTDLVIENKIRTPPAVYDSGIGVEIEDETIRQDPGNEILARGFHTQLEEEGDINKIEMPEVVYDEEETKRRHKLLKEIFDGILPVEMGGTTLGEGYVSVTTDEGSQEYPIGYSPWDDLTTLRGPDQVLRDVIKEPDFIHKAMEKMVDTYIHRLEQLQESDLLARNDRNLRIGSGGYGYTGDLPSSMSDSNRVTGKDMWGFCTAQIFSEVSPERFWEFAISHELRWLEKFGLTYYGCCEPLHDRIDVLRRIPNLRKISMSPWADWEQGAEEVGRDYVLSLKPNPAILAEDEWRPDEARKNIRRSLEKTEPSNVEIIMKDITTVRDEPKRLWEWTKIAQEETREFAEEHSLPT